jgi:putative ABC transport system substrate-binding protein
VRRNDEARTNVGRVTLIAALALGLFAAPLTSHSQQPTKVARVGVLLYSTPQADSNIGAFVAGMRDLGYVEGRNLAVEYRFAEGKPERLPGLAAELVRVRPDVIFVLGGDVASYAKQATDTIPIVMAVSTDPVQQGLVASLARPGGNITGVTFVADELAGKRLELLREAAPRASRVAFLWNPDHPDPEFRETQRAARTLGVQLIPLEVRRPADFDAAFQTATAEPERAQAVLAISSRLMTLHRQRIADFAARNRLPLIGGWGPWAEVGGLMSYGPNLNEVVRRAATYVDKILKGARPGDLPVEQPTKFELVVNLRTAKALGLTIPPSVLIRADQVIE